MLNLRQLKPLAVDLDLRVLAPNEDQLARITVPYEIASLVETLQRGGGEALASPFWCGNEGGSGFVGLVDVAPADGGAFEDEC